MSDPDDYVTVIPMNPTSPAASPGDLANLLLITHESVGEKMAGPGIRAWEMARAVGQHGARVTLATPFPSTRSAPNVEIRTFAWDDPIGLAGLIEQAGVVMATGWVTARINTLLGRPIEQPVIVDAYYVPEIEQVLFNLLRQEQADDATPVFLQDLFVYLRQGDFFLCTLDSQVDFWMGAFMAAGRINAANLRQQPALEQLLAVVPFGLPVHAPPAPAACMKGVVPGIEASDRVLYWGGGIWDWTDPDTYLDALEIVFRQRSDARAVFGALHHFSPETVPAMSAASRLAGRVQRAGWLGSRVFFLDWVPYDRRSDYLQEADLGVSLVQHTLENRYAIRSRLLDHLWTGLPSVLTSGDEMAAVLASARLAHLVTPGDAQGTAQAILDWLEQPQAARAERSAGLESLRRRYAWSKAVQPVVDFLRSPRLAADSVQARSTIGEMTSLRREWERLRTQAGALEEEVRILRSSRPVRMADALGNFLARLGIRL